MRARRPFKLERVALQFAGDVGKLMHGAVAVGAVAYGRRLSALTIKNAAKTIRGPVGLP